MFSPLLYELRQIISTTGTDYNNYSADEKAVVAKCLSLITAIKAVLDTPILTEDGALTEEALIAYNQIQDKINI